MSHSSVVWAAILLVAALCAGPSAQAGHESPFYPSFYPQEIRIETLDPRTAEAGWPQARVHAYVGERLFAAGAVSADATAVTSLRSYLVLTFDAVDDRYAISRGDARSRCQAVGRILRALPRDAASYVFHPYPVTPYHADYLEQYDLAARARAAYAKGGADGAAEPALKIRAKGALAETLVPATWRATPHDWDATLEEIDVGALTKPVSEGLSGQVTAPWVKQGWFQAYLLYAGDIRGPAAVRAEREFRRLTTGEYRSEAQRIDLERALVTTLAAGCKRVVVGYTLREEYFDSEYYNGVENVAFDSQAGLLSPIFPRSVKLKDFPWNGWLRVGISTQPIAAWNPVSGFTDPFGRLLWQAVGDPALLPEPYGGSWMANRASIDVGAVLGSSVMPDDALRPQEGSGLLRRVGPGKSALQRLRFSVVASAFHDGTATGIADVLYPYIFAFRWGARGSDPAIARATAPVRDWLAGFKVIGVTTQTRNFGDDLNFTYRVPVVDVYLTHRSSDALEAAAVAPPWSTIPWEVFVLMEQAAQRGIAAFSEAEAQRRGIPWLDLVRDRATVERLAAVVDELGSRAYRPTALKELVTPDEARERWRALARFYTEHGHFLVTNGPYMLDSWSADGAVLKVFRDPTYPKGVGTFDPYAIPLRAYATRIEHHRERIDIQADVEQVSRSQRSYEIERVALAARDEARSDDPPVCRYVIVAPSGKVVRSGRVGPSQRGRFTIDLKGLAAPGLYTIAAALFLGGNEMNPEIQLIEHRAGVR